MTHDLLRSTSLRDLIKLSSFKRKRISSYDKSGGNLDMVFIKPGEKTTIFNVDGPGCINHIWTTQMVNNAKFWPRHIIIRMWWDDEETPSVECPLGDFFGLGHGDKQNFVSEPLQMSPQNGKAFNSWWVMPFKNHARIEIENDNPTSLIPDSNFLLKKKPGIMFYYYVDYELFESWPKDETPIGYFHAQFHRVDYKNDMQTNPDSGEKYSLLEWQMLAGKNTRENGGYDRNHFILKAKGKGHYVGCNINIDNFPFPLKRRLYNWPGEGDDMIFIDDDIGGEPTLYGTGTEDYVNTAFCPQEKYSAPYHGVIKGGGFNWEGKITYYRYHIQDPIPFEKAIEVTIEHGHNNHRGDDWATTAYWYQLEPHAPFPPFPSREDRNPRKDLNWLHGLLKVGVILLKCLGFTAAVFAAIKILTWIKIV
ncbi:hypothetical protein NEF87_002911 [Candidatus Lokiarchaeum ossiferum]|uniref:DUF2961 domain-containing protein n=1 Tax=Candidatus Lokiarchaeum ossiferum TaxID=2951803 RepID=A0ABY6HT87_9ARCH|nr:hypothetical protein NEF87_002911 [Candidatus Lokiarchaeum sp. B-35]